ncbi:aldehyde dehydrogenase family protein [Streptococcus pneumoniae]|uniref:aldehyde dehydrogenase family protein n=1 Tax=Streptococcus pneumoniae TaxID=1313 RepID=UPI000766AC73|nr:aldehyde dehydrogenase family protein [Streptococcus pneumoniae]CWL89119.1 NADP-dependent glyceraldehyde-3-phosphate dehydrogenase [Streptococcus pneumoniae]
MTRYQNLVNGKWKSSEQEITIYSPINQEELGTVPAMTQTEADEAMQAARAALPAWRALSAVERAAYLHKTAAILERDKEEIGTILAKEVAKGIKAAIGEVVRTADLIRYAAEEGLRITGQAMEGGGFEAASKNKLAVVRREPVGIVLAIAPFNYPVNLSASKIAPALIAGNVVMFKPPTQGSISGLLLAKAFEEAGIPAGVFNTITGRGSEIGDYIIEHKEVNFINFTGSTPIGERIGRLAGMRPIMLELGGKQEEVSKLTVGDPFDNADITPVIDNASADFIWGLIEDAQEKEAQALTPIKREGNLLWPVLFDQVTKDMKVAWEEPFGPVLPIIRVASVEEAIAFANESEFGLQSSVFTNDFKKAFEIAEKLEVGTVHINNKTQRGPDNFPFLGVKGSGAGVQGIKYSIEAMTNVKSIVFDVK